MELWLQFAIMVPLTVGELVLIGILLRHHDARAIRATPPLVATLALLAIWASGLAAAFVGRPISRMFIFWWQRVATYAFPLAASPLFFATWAVLHRRLPFPKRWYWVPTVGLVAAVVLDPAVVPLRVPDWHILGRVIPHEGWWQMVWTVLWAAPTAVTWWIALVRRPRQAGLRTGNRFRYWTLTLTISLVADALVLSGQTLMTQCAGLIKLLAGGVMTTTLLIRPLPDIGRVLNLAAGGLFRVATAFLALGGTLWLGVWLERRWGDNGTWIPLLIALAAGGAGAYSLARFVVPKLVGRWSSRAQLETEWWANEYERRIDHELQVEQLATRLVTVTNEAIGAEYATVATIDSESDGDLTIRPVFSRGCTPPDRLHWEATSPLVSQLVARREPLSAGDLETDPAFDSLPDVERIELNTWASELLVPITSDDQVLGLLAVGPKRTGARYGASDLDLLARWAAQTGPALAYARRMDRLIRENARAAEKVHELERAHRELLEIDRLKSDLIGTLTHDLRVPFVAIDQTLTELESGEPQSHDHVTQLSQSLGDLRRLVDYLIGFASMIGKQGALQLQSVQLADVVDQVTHSLEIMSLARRVTITSSLHEHPVSFLADRERLADAVYQIMHNAIKFNRAGGEVKVCCKSGPQWVTLEVADTGCGIPPEQLRQLEMPGMPLSEGEERVINGMGMGLGLALARYVAQVHGGRLEIETELGYGSTFRLHLPIGGPQQESGREVSPGR